MEQLGKLIAAGLAAPLNFIAKIAQASPGPVVVEHFTKGGAACGGHTAHAGIVDELAPTGGHQRISDGGGAHIFQHAGNSADTGSNGTVHLADLKQMVVPGEVLG